MTRIKVTARSEESGVRQSVKPARTLHPTQVASQTRCVTLAIGLQSTSHTFSSSFQSAVSTNMRPRLLQQQVETRKLQLNRLQKREQTHRRLLNLTGLTSCQSLRAPPKMKYLSRTTALKNWQTLMARICLYQATLMNSLICST